MTRLRQTTALVETHQRLGVPRLPHGRAPVRQPGRHVARRPRGRGADEPVPPGHPGPRALHRLRRLDGYRARARDLVSASATSAKTGRMIPVNQVVTLIRDEAGEPNLSPQRLDRPRRERSQTHAPRARGGAERGGGGEPRQERLLAKISHELRTPLSAILGFTQLLSREPGIEAQPQEYLRSSARAGSTCSLSSTTRWRCRGSRPGASRSDPRSSTCASSSPALKRCCACAPRRRGSRSGSSSPGASRASSAAMRRSCGRSCSTCSATRSSSPRAARSSCGRRPAPCPQTVASSGSTSR